MKSKTFAWILVVSVALAVPVRLSAQKQMRYTVTDLGTLGGTFSQSVGISNRGSIGGFSTPPGDAVVHAFFWEKGVMTDLGTLGGANSEAPEAWAPSDRGEVAGYSDTLTLDPNAENFCAFITGFGNTSDTCLPFIWRDGVMTPLPLLGGNNGIANAVNNRGEVAGVAEINVPDSACVPPLVLHFEPVIWTNGQPHQLPTVNGDPDGLIQGINDHGQAVGFTGSCFPVHAVLWNEGKPIDLGTFGGAVFNIAFGINNRGQVVGQSDLPGDVTHHAFLWQKGVMTDLGTLPGDFTSIALSINNKTQMVGLSLDASGNVVSPVLWQNGVIIDLNNLIPADSPLFLLQALGINDRGQIVGYGLRTDTGETHAYVATPCDDERASEKGCGDQSPFAARGETRQRPHMDVPENVRRLLQQRLGGWYPALRTPRN